MYLANQAHSMIIKGSISALILLFSLCSAPAFGQTDPAIDKIKEAWKKRQELVKSATFSWTTKRTDSRGFISSILPPRPDNENKPIPPNDTTLIVKGSLILDGANIRYYLEDQQWSASANSYVRRPYISTRNGESAKMLLPEGSTINSFPSGRKNLDNQHLDTKVPNLRPIMTAIRGVQPESRTYIIDDMRPTGRQLKIQDHNCIEIERKVTQKTTDRLYVDPARDYIVTRFMGLNSEHVFLKIDVNYVQSTDHIWIPDSWNITVSMDQGKYIQTLSAKVTEYSINPTLDSKIFDIDFPVGALVNDQKNDEQFIVKENGEKRIVRREESNKTYDELLRSPSSGGSLWEWSVWVGIIVAVLAVAIVIVNRYRSKYNSKA